MPATGKINVFYSYAREDEKYRDQLVRELGALRKEGIVSEWHDRMIKPGGDWQRDIEDNLEDAHVVLFLVSPDFMKSDYCIGVEVERAVELHFARRCRIVPIIVRPTPSWFTSKLKGFQALPRDAKPISAWDNTNAAFESVVDGIRTVCDEVVDWENPIRRSVVGDWVEYEYTMVVQGQRIVSRGRAEITAKNNRIATLKNAGVFNGEYVEASLDFPLDRPIIDSIGQVFDQVGENLPPNAVFTREETGRGDQKLLVGRKTYNCQWVASRGSWEIGGGGDVVMTTKTWRSIDVPIDGLVKEESVVRAMATGQEISRSTKVLLAFGNG